MIRYGSSECSYGCSDTGLSRFLTGDYLTSACVLPPGFLVSFYPGVRGTGLFCLLTGVLIRYFKGFSRELAVRECSDCLRVLDKGFSREFAVRECSDCSRVLDKGFSREFAVREYVNVIRLHECALRTFALLSCGSMWSGSL